MHLHNAERIRTEGCNQVSRRITVNRDQTSDVASHGGHDACKEKVGGYSNNPEVLVSDLEDPKDDRHVEEHG